MSPATTATITPHPHDVLLLLSGGRGHSKKTRGHFYHHEGNAQFRTWVVEHCTSYQHASNNQEKRSIVREVIALVQNQNPPGRFLKRDPTDAGRWIEVDDDKVARKTGKALFMIKIVCQVDENYTVAALKQAEVRLSHILYTVVVHGKCIP
jgi:hypothetical protein